LRETFGHRSRERVLGRWDVDRMVQRIASVYEDVDAGRMPRQEVPVGP